MTRAEDLTAAMGAAVDPLRLMQRVTDRTLELIGPADGVMVGLADHDGITYVAGAGHRVSHLGTSVTVTSSLSGVALLTGEVQVSMDTGSDPRVDSDACRRLSVVSLVCVPLRRHDTAIGVLAVNSVTAHAFDDDDVATLTQLADFISVVIGSACDLSRVNSALLDTTTTAATVTDATRRYVMDVLSPGAVHRVDSGQRVQRVLDDPSTVSVVFQPIIDLVDGDAVAAVEALARFDVTPYRTPDMWFGDARANGLGLDLEMLAIGRAVARLQDLPDGVVMTINAGPDTVVSRELYDLVAACASERIVVELTEHTAIGDYPALVAAIRSLRMLGARVAIDDTGSGYSSLTHILKIAPDFIKLDRDLVSGIDLDPVRRALAASLVSFADDTGAHIIAEGIENADELDTVRRLGARYAQGYHLARPAALADLAFQTARAAPAPR